MGVILSHINYFKMVNIIFLQAHTRVSKMVIS